MANEFKIKNGLLVSGSITGITEASSDNSTKMASTAWVRTYAATIGGNGTVTSVALTVPTGLSVTGSPITSSGTLAITLTSGYSIPTTASQTNWNTAYGWGNHASAGYLTGITSSQVTTALGYTPYNATNPSGYITGITSSMVTTALGFTPYNSTNPSGYLTASTVLNTVLTPYAVGSNTAVTATDTIETAIEKLQGQINARGTGNGTVTSVSGTGTVSGLTLSGTVTTSGSLTLGGTLTLTSGQITTGLGYTPYSGSVTTNYLPKATGAATLGNSIIYDSGTQIGVGTINPNTRLGIVWNNGSSGSVVDIQNTNAAGGSAIDFYNNSGTYMGNMGGYAGHGSLAIDSWLGGISLRASGVEAARIATTRQLRLNAYTATTSFTGTAAGVLAFDSNGNILTIATPGGTTLNGTGFVKASGTTITYDNSTYVPTTGTGATGTWGISISGSAATATSATSATFLNSSNYIQRTSSSGNYNTDFQNTPAGSVRHLGDDANIANNPGGAWWFLDNYRHTNASNLWGTQVAWGWEDNANRLATRNITGGSFGSWVYYVNSANVSTYALPIGGGTLTGGLQLNSTLTINSSATSDVANGMRTISHSVTGTGDGINFIRINGGTSNVITGWIFVHNFDNNSYSTGSGSTFQFAFWTDGSGVANEKYFDQLWFGGNNIGIIGRTYNVAGQGNGLMIRRNSSTGAGGYKCQATVMFFARDMSKVSIQYY